MAPTPAIFFRLPVFAVLLGLIVGFFGGISRGERTETLSLIERSVENWGIEEGLPNSSVSSLVQTPDGYLWVGTWNGLTRFDGVRFTNFNPVNTPQLMHARVVNLEVDARGVLWINTYDGSLTSFKDGVFTLEHTGELGILPEIHLIPSRSGQLIFNCQAGLLLRRPIDFKGAGGWSALIPPARIRQNAVYCEDAKGVLWCVTRDQHMWQVVGNTFVPVPYGKTLETTRGLSISVDPHGQIWARTEKEIAVWDGERFQNRNPRSGDPLQDVELLQFSRDGGMWIAANKRLRKAQGQDWVLDPKDHSFPFDHSASFFQTLYEDSAGGIWNAPPHSGVLHILPDGTSEVIDSSNGLPTEHVTCCCEDQEGNMWLGTERGGLVRIGKKRFHLLGPADSGLTTPTVSVCEDAAGAIWVGTFGGGLKRWQNGTATDFNAPGGPIGHFVFSVYPDLKGNVWTSAGREDLHVLENNELQRAVPPVHGVKSMLVDRKGRLWLGTRDSLFCRTEEGVKDYASDGFAHKDIRALAEDRNGAVWIGTGDGSIFRFDERTFTRFSPDDIHTQPAVWSLLGDADGTLWIGTFGGGLLRFKDGQFTRYTKKSGLPDDVISQLLDDGAGHLWIGSYQGIFSVSKTALHEFAAGKLSIVPCSAYGHHDGLPSLECSGGYQPSAWRGRDGRLWFSTAKGVVFVQPHEMSTHSPPPRVVVEDVVVDGLSRLPKMEKGQISLDVVSGKQHFEFHYTGLYLTAPDEIRFRYRLDGLEKEWTDAGTRRWAPYSYLRPGDYRFLVSACNNDGVWNETGASLKLHVLPRFWETWWFFGLLVLAALGAVAGSVYRVSTNKLHRELALVEQQRAIEEDRARIARDIHDDLGAGLTQITLFSELLRRSPPERLEGHIQQISHTAHSLTRAMDEIVWAVNPKHDTLDSLVSYTFGFSEEYLRTAGVRCRLDIPAQLPARNITSEVRHEIFLAVKEVLNNILKHANASEVYLRLRTDLEKFVLTIEDNGEGIRNGEHVHKVNGFRHASGQGHRNLEERMTTVGGSYQRTSEPGRGTCVILTIPFGVEKNAAL